MTYRKSYLPWARSTLVIAILTTSACATSHSVLAPPSRDHQTPQAGIPPLSPEDIRQIEAEILVANAEFEKAESQTKHSTRPRIPLEINENVLKWIRYFTITDRERFHRFLKRGSAYRELVKNILREHGVPTELYYLAMIESGYVTHAKSHASAVGIWQFIPGTGLRFGLNQSHELDERRDIVRSTEAAAKYLRNLHTAFQCWYLAMAGYNAGEGRILGAVMRGESRDFWELVEKKALPPETRNYVPKFLAAAIIGKNPGKYGFRDLDAPAFPELEAAQVAGGVRLGSIAEKTSIPLDLLKQINPHLLRDTTPGRQASYKIWVPKGKESAVRLAQSELARMAVRSSSTAASPVASVSARRLHVVRRGENLTGIARQYGMTLSSLKRLNGIRSNHLNAGSKLTVDRPAKATNRKVVHKVRSGEALERIAELYKVPVFQIRRANELRSSRIYVGQRLVIPTGT